MSSNDLQNEGIREDVGITRTLIELHRYSLQGNKFDEGDLIFYRINYRLVALFGITRRRLRASMQLTIGIFQEQYLKDIVISAMPSLNLFR